VLPLRYAKKARPCELPLSCRLGLLSFSSCFYKRTLAFLSVVGNRTIIVRVSFGSSGVGSNRLGIISFSPSASALQADPSLVVSGAF
jgi:hypothetical protein